MKKTNKFPRTVYLIKLNFDTPIYVGSTSIGKEKRLAQLKCKGALTPFKNQILTVEEIDTISSVEDLYKEYYWICYYRFLNPDLVNKNKALWLDYEGQMTSKEYFNIQYKNYRKNNKEYVREYCREFYNKKRKENPEKYREYMREYMRNYNRKKVTGK